MIFANLRVQLLNWLAAPSRTRFVNAQEKENDMAVGNYQIHTTNNTGYTLGVNTGNSHAPQPVDLKNGINLTVTPASGGWIVQINRIYQDPQLYIVPEEQDLGVELGKIITMSCLKK